MLGGKKRGELEIGGVSSYSAGFIEDITSAIAGVDILLHPSRSEGLGTSVIDAMSVGVPPIAFSVGGLSEVIEHEKNGLLIPQGDVEEFGRAAEILMRDGDFRRYLGANARLRASQFSADAMTEDTEAVYYDLMSRSENESSSSILRSTSA
jgi:glycosyltransferase involved in cell wall biosynthesis